MYGQEALLKQRAALERAEAVKYGGGAAPAVTLAADLGSLLDSGELSDVTLGPLSMEHRFAPPRRQRAATPPLPDVWPRWSCCREPVTRASRACSLHGQNSGPQGKKGGGGGGGVPVSGAAGGCLPALGCFHRRQPPHHAAQYASSRWRCVAGQRPVNNNTACRRAAPNRQPHLAAAAAQRAAASSAFSVLGITLHARRRCGGRRQRRARTAAARPALRMRCRLERSL